jgi:hypothetical protein
MTRAFRFGNYGVYVYDERGQPHRLPHAHVKRQRGRRVASFFLMTLTTYDEIEPLPSDLLAEIRKEQQHLLDLWAQLNPDD